MMVRSLTVAGLAVKKSLEESFLRDDYTPPALGKRRKANSTSGPTEKRRREGTLDEDAEYTLPVNSLFLPPAEGRTALRPENIQDAFARMQGEWSHHRSAGMTNWRGGLVRSRVSRSWNPCIQNVMYYICIPIISGPLYIKCTLLLYLLSV